MSKVDRKRQQMRMSSTKQRKTGYCWMLINRRSLWKRSVYPFVYYAPNELWFRHHKQKNLNLFTDNYLTHRIECQEKILAQMLSDNYTKCSTSDDDTWKQTHKVTYVFTWNDETMKQNKIMNYVNERVSKQSHLSADDLHVLKEITNCYCMLSTETPIIQKIQQKNSKMNVQKWNVINNNKKNGQFEHMIAGFTTTQRND